MMSTADKALRSRKERLAHGVSDVFNPPAVLGVLLVYLLWRLPGNTHQKVLWYTTTIMFTLIIPFLLVLWALKRDILSDKHITNRNERPIPILIAASLLILLDQGFRVLNAPILLRQAILVSLISLAIIFVITFFWKVSLHTATLTGALGVLVLTWSTLWPSFTLLPLVAWARIQAKAHTPMQTIGGSLVASIALYLTFHAY